MKIVISSFLDPNLYGRIRIQSIVWILFQIRIRPSSHKQERNLASSIDTGIFLHFYKSNQQLLNKKQKIVNKTKQSEFEQKQIINKKFKRKKLIFKIINFFY